jgi:bifunctional non-homologous end joining protein LigD
MLATNDSVVPMAPGWAFELKWDGVRGQLHVLDGSVRIFTRRGRDVTSLLPELQELRHVAGDETILDGELVVQRDDGSPDFEAMMARLISRRHGGRPGVAAVTFIAFDLLLDRGAALVDARYLERRRRLELRPRVAPSWYAPEPLLGDGSALFREACRRGLEGVVAKRLDGRYRPGARTDTWRKLKNPRHPAYERVRHAWRR